MICQGETGQSLRTYMIIAHILEILSKIVLTNPNQPQDIFPYE